MRKRWFCETKWGLYTTKEMATGWQATTYPTHNSPVAYHLSICQKSRITGGSIWDCVEMDNRPNYHLQNHEAYYQPICDICIHLYVYIYMIISICVDIYIYIQCHWSIDLLFVKTILKEECDILSL